jgi:predicted O-methyltransferase YrrM
MKTFREVYKIVEESSHETAFNEGEAKGLYWLLQELKPYSVVVEIGVQFGRSTTVIAEVSKEKRFAFYAVDSWKEANGDEAYDHVSAQMQKHFWNFNLISADSIEYSKSFQGDIDLIHIDGDHSYKGVKADCEAWLGKVISGGYACFDDYGHPGLEDVQKAVDEYIVKNRKKWIYIGTYGNKLGVFKRI